MDLTSPRQSVACELSEVILPGTIVLYFAAEIDMDDTLSEGDSDTVDEAQS